LPAAADPVYPRKYPEMSLRIAINGYGRIGRCFLRALQESALRDAVSVVAINEPADIDSMAYLTRFDSTHGRFPGSVAVRGRQLHIDDQAIAVSHARTPDGVDWRALGIDLLVEASGQYASRTELNAFLAAGCPRILLSHPGHSAEDVDRTIVFGSNHESLTGDERIVSAASCTTNAIVPVLKAVNDKFGIVNGHVETVHSYTNDQNLIDNFHKGDRRGRSAALNMVITETGAATAAAKALPELAGKLTGNAIRVPTPNVSMAILNLNLEKATTREEINEYLRQMAMHSDLHKQIDYVNSQEVVSTDFVGSRHAGVVDAEATITQDNRVVLYVWYDNEFGYSCQVVRVMEDMAGVNPPAFPR
ncbi:MAG: glyceraldehyde-3-phosphate dehydrogenase, partial [Pseudomonas sp.]|uniref:glyceraldehyde-3-phosphate dehydrogenase n=1 Tax=Pseudomonas sp. TaxID=306 RepID=UPI002719E0B7